MTVENENKISIIKPQMQSRHKELMGVFAEFLNLSVADGEPSDDTVKAYYREVGRWVMWCQEKNINPENAQRQDIELYRYEMRVSGLQPVTRRFKISIIRRFYDAMMRRGLIESNPAHGVKGGVDLTPNEEKIKSYTEESLDTIFDVIKGNDIAATRDRCIVGLMAIHGLRRIEVQRANHEHLTLGSDVPEMMIDGKGKKSRKIYLREDVVKALKEYIAAKLVEGLPLKEALFVSLSNQSRGQRLGRSSLNFIVDGHFNDAGLKKAGMSCHALRHTHGTLAVKGGADVKQLQPEMGHSDLNTTMIYVDILERQLSNPAQFIKPNLYKNKENNE